MGYYHKRWIHSEVQSLNTMNYEQLPKRLVIL
jgi:hypothetical protein